MRDDDLKALETRWHELFDQYDAVKAMIAPIVRWEWTNTNRYDPRPFYFQRNPPRGRVLKRPPADAQQKIYRHEYGFDEQGRVTIERYYTYYDHLIWETFYSYPPDEVVTMAFSKYQGRFLLRKIARGVMQSGKMQRYVSLETGYSYIDRSQPFPAPGQLNPYQGAGLETATADEIWTQLSSQRYAIQWHHEEYIYQKRRLALIREYSLHRLCEPYERDVRFEYDAKGRLQRIVNTRQGGHEWAVYRRRQPGETLASLTDHAKRKLIEAIPKTVAAAKFDEPLYCLNLYYFVAKSGDYFPPKLWPGFERDRQYKLKQYLPDRVDGYIWWYLWSDKEAEPDLPIRESLSITDAETLEACERLEVEINMRQQAPIAVRTLYQISQELNRLDWSQYAPVTPDFIVYACDQTEHTEITVSLRRSGATKEQIVDWRKRGILYS